MFGDCYAMNKVMKILTQVAHINAVLATNFAKVFINPAQRSPLKKNSPADNRRAKIFRRNFFNAGNRTVTTKIFTVTRQKFFRNDLEIFSRR